VMSRISKDIFVLISLLSAVSASASPAGQPILRGDFDFHFRVEQTDIRSDSTKQLEWKFYAADHPNASGTNAQNAFMSTKPLQEYSLTLISSTGGMRYRLTGSGTDKLFDYDESKDMSYSYDMTNQNCVSASNGLDRSALSVFPYPGVGLYAMQMFSTSNPLSGHVTGTGYITENGSPIPAVATFDANSQTPRCLSYTAYFKGINGTLLPRYKWTFSNFIPFAGKQIAREALCISYYAYNPPQNPPEPPSRYEEETRTLYILDSVGNAPPNMNYSGDSMLHYFGLGRNPSIEYFHDHQRIVTFCYNSTGLPLEVQKSRALALQPSKQDGGQIVR